MFRHTPFQFKPCDGNDQDNRNSILLLDKLVQFAKSLSGDRHFSFHPSKILAHQDIRPGSRRSSYANHDHQVMEMMLCAVNYHPLLYAI